MKDDATSSTHNFFPKMELISNIKGKEKNNWVNSYKRKQKFIYIFINIFNIYIINYNFCFDIHQKKEVKS